tara:strand:- start:155 stop:766 length:612 start_codon:yes stop_codon:yes gene_type:complete
MNISIIDIGISNIFSIKSAIENLGFTVKCINDPKDISKADKIILPGVGSFKSAMHKINQYNLIESLFENIIIKKKLFLGICVGMQVLAKKGYEMGECDGLSYIDCEVKNLKDLGSNLQIPHIGWNHINLTKNIITKDIPQNSDFYFLHSFSIDKIDKNYIIGVADYGVNIVSIVNKENIFGTQFHPEKSSKNGKILLKNFLEI